MSEATPEKVKGVVGTYYAFLIKRIDEIYEAWDYGDLQLAMHRAFRLTASLPKALKDNLDDDMQRISKELDVAYTVNSSNWLGKHMARNRAANDIAHRHLRPYIDKMMGLLDDRGYLEQPGVTPRNPNPKHITEDSV